MSTTSSNAQNLWAQSLLNLAPNLTSQLQGKVMKKADLDGSGAIDASEFQAALDKVATKFGLPVSGDANTLFQQADTDGDALLSGAEMTQALLGLLAPASSGTQAFVQSRGDEARFTELDTDGDGVISKAEFGIGNAEAGLVTTTTTTVTTVQSTADGDTATASAEPGAITSRLQELVAGLDTDNDGQISGQELTAFIAQLSSQLELASRLYNQNPSGSGNATA